VRRDPQPGALRADHHGSGHAGQPADAGGVHPARQRPRLHPRRPGLPYPPPQRDHEDWPCRPATCKLIYIVLTYCVEFVGECVFRVILVMGVSWLIYNIVKCVQFLLLSFVVVLLNSVFNEIHTSIGGRNHFQL